MEEIGFIYVFALSVLLLTAIFFTIRDSTDSQKETATKTYLEDQVRLIAGVVQNVIDMQLNHPEVEYSRVLDLRSPDQIYQYRIDFSITTVSLVSRFEEISTSINYYNPLGFGITPTVESDASAFMVRYDPDARFIEIRVVDPGQAFL